MGYHDRHVPVIRHADWTQASTPLTAALLEAQDLTIVTTAHSGVDYARVVAHSTRVLETRNATKVDVEHRDRITLL